MAAHGLMFHHFCDHRHPWGQGAITAAELAELIDHVGRRHILPADEWMRRALAGTLGDTDLCLTFDDALLCQYDVAVPVLKQFGLTAFWFVYSSVLQGNIEPLEIYRHFRMTEFSSVDDFYNGFGEAVSALYPEEYASAMAGFVPESYLSAYPFYTRTDRIFRYLRDDVLGPERYHPVMREMMDRKGFDGRDIAARLWMNDRHLVELRDAGHLIGLHSHSHPTRLARLPLAEQESEYQRNFDHLKAVLGEAPLCMSHPRNSYAAETLPILRRLGITLGFRDDMIAIENRSLLELPRQDHTNIMRDMQA